MKCDGARESMILALYDELPEDVAIELEQHLSLCTGCAKELDSTREAVNSLAAYPFAEPDPNLLAQSRMRLDAALDELPRPGLFSALRFNALAWMGHLRGAPALATLLLGVGFLAGNFTNQYQVARRPPARPPVVITDVNGGGVSDISAITHLPGEMVQVSYNRIVPEMVQGSLDSPLIRNLLMIGTRDTANSSVHVDSVNLLAGECRIGHDCQIEPLLTTLHKDHNPSVRLRALEGLGRYVSQDQRVRDAMAQALLTDPSTAVRTRAIALLEPVQGDTSVRQVLQKVSTRDDNPYIRTVSTQALVGTGSFQ